MSCNELYPAYAYLLYSVMLAEPKPDDTYKIEFRKEEQYRQRRWTRPRAIFPVDMSMVRFVRIWGLANLIQGSVLSGQISGVCVWCNDCLMMTSHLLTILKKGQFIVLDSRDHTRVSGSKIPYSSV